MSFTETELSDIRSIFIEELEQDLDPIKGELKALSNDIKEIYKMIAQLQNKSA